MKRVVIFILFSLPIILFSQIRISGSVREISTKQPIPYVSVYFPKYNIGTITDMNGNFSIHIADTVTNNSLVFSCVGYQKKEIPVSQLIRQEQVYLQESQLNISGVEVKALSYDALLTLVDRVFKKARSNKQSVSGKLFYSLMSEKENEPLELIEAFCSATQSMEYGLEEMKMKNGRIGTNTETENKFMSLSSTNIIVNFVPYHIPANSAGLPAIPSNHSLQKMKDAFSFWEDGLIQEDTSTLQKISFRSKSEPFIEGYILFYKNTFLMKQYDLWFYNAKNILFPVEKNDRVDSVDIHLTYTYKNNENKIGQMLLEHVDMDYSLKYYDARNDDSFRINTNLFFLFYDYRQPFTPPFFRDVNLPSDYVKIWTFPHMEEFWEYNYFLPQNERKEQHLQFFKKHGIVKTEEDADFKPNIEELRSPLQTWSKERLNLVKMPINAMFQSDYQEQEFFDLAKFEMRDHQYNVDAQIFLNYFCLNDSLYFASKTFINLDDSYFLLTPNAYASAFVNMYFDLFEMSRRNLDKTLNQLSSCNPDKINAIYEAEIQQLGRNISRFKKDTRQATDIEGMLYWRKIINDSLQIDNQLLLEEKMPPRTILFDELDKSAFPSYQYNTGVILLKLGQYEEAARCFTKVINRLIDSQPEKSDSYYNRAIAYYYLGDMDLFCDDLQKVVKLEGSSEDINELLRYCR